jgi:peptidoglycan/xylan/chitin deacetylase (PgdA/CDA1 family)
MLSWAQLGEIASRGVEIGAHSHSHPDLDTLPQQKAWQEIADCKRHLETELGAVVVSFAYPHGYSSPRVRRLVREAGYQSATPRRWPSVQPGVLAQPAKELGPGV